MDTPTTPEPSSTFAPDAGRAADARAWRRGAALSLSRSAVIALAFAAAGALVVSAPPRSADHGASSADFVAAATTESASAPHPSRTDSPAPAGASRGTLALMRNVDFHADSTIVLHVRHLRGTVRSTSGGPIVFDDKDSFAFRLAWAEVAVSAADLGALLNRYVFAVDGSPLRDLEVRFVGAEIEQSGKLKKGLWFPFRIRATVHATPDGRLRLHPTRVRVLGLPAEGVMRALGIALEDLVSTERLRGIAVEGNDLLLDPAALLPAPRIEGRLTSARVDGDRLVQVFGSEESAAALGPLHVPVAADGNYMFYRGGTLRF
ncbi:MAG TPA: hypothetical protein VLE53_00500, partial [Gemmatimonadaceae bacterium]|nr:hypothetical protein [Gemmatimonadaceae bacterium]